MLIASLRVLAVWVEQPVQSDQPDQKFVPGQDLFGRVASRGIMVSLRENADISDEMSLRHYQAERARLSVLTQTRLRPVCLAAYRARSAAFSQLAASS